MGEILQITAIFGAIFSIVLGTAQLLQKKKKLRAYFLALLLLTIGILLLYGYLFQRDLNLKPHSLNYLFGPFLFFLGPVKYFYFQLSVNPDFKVSPRNLISLAPGLLLLVAIPLLELIFPSIYPDAPLGYFRGRSISWLELIGILGFSFNVVYYLVIVYIGRSVFTRKNLRSEVSARFLFLTLVFSFLIALLALSGFLLRNLDLVFYAATSISLLVVGVFLYIQRYPQIYLELETVIQRDSYEKSKLLGKDLGAINERLERLMTEEEAYLDDGLSLALVAEKVGLNPHQLSEYLNKNLSVSFASFVNRYRVEAAAEIFRSESAANVLSVAYKVGFNSKSSFNTAFRKQYGKTPVQYRNSVHSG